MSSVKKLVKDVFSSCHERGTKKMLSFQEESNHRPGSALRCPTTEPQRLHGEQSPLRSSCKASQNRGLSSRAHTRNSKLVGVNKPQVRERRVTNSIIYNWLYNKLSYALILIGSHLWSIGGQTYRWRHH